MPSEILQINAKYNQSGAHNVGCAHGSAPTGALPWAQRCMRVDSSPWERRSALTGAQLNATRLLWLNSDSMSAEWLTYHCYSPTHHYNLPLLRPRVVFWPFYINRANITMFTCSRRSLYSRPIGDLNLSGFWESSNFLQIAPPPSLYVWFSRNFARNSVRCVTIRKKLWIRFSKFWF